MKGTERLTADPEGLRPAALFVGVLGDGDDAEDFTIVSVGRNCKFRALLTCEDVSWCGKCLSFDRRVPKTLYHGGERVVNNLVM